MCFFESVKQKLLHKKTEVFDGMPVAELKVRKHKEFTTHEWSYSIPATKPAAHPRFLIRRFVINLLQTSLRYLPAQAAIHHMTQISFSYHPDAESRRI